MHYSEKLLLHFYQPQNVGKFPPDEKGVGRAIKGNYKNGAVVHFEIKIENDKVMAAKFKAYGSCAIIAGCSFATEWVKNKTVEEVMNFTSSIMITELAIPDIKIHSALFVEDVVKAAIIAASNHTQY